MSDSNQHLPEGDDDEDTAWSKEDFERREARFFEIFGPLLEEEKPPPVTLGYENDPQNCPARRRWEKEKEQRSRNHERWATQRAIEKDKKQREEEARKKARNVDPGAYEQTKIKEEIQRDIVTDPELVEDIKPWGQTRWGEFYSTAEEHLLTLKQQRALYGDWLDPWTHYKGDPCVHCEHTTKRLYGGACIHCTPAPTRSTILAERERGSKNRYFVQPWRRKARALMLAGWSRDDIASELRIDRSSVGRERVIFFVEAVKAGDVEAALILAPEMSRRGGRKLRAGERMKRLKEKKMAEPLLKPRGDIDE